jgi:formamidopyrimidine-DNA glycosylase
VRRFGLVTYCESAKIKENHLISKLGLDPWDENLTAEYLLNKLQNKKLPIKICLLDQEIICGIGNIYASEILYLARIHPERSAESITLSEIKRLIKYTREVLESAIKAGGSSIHDYVHPDGDIGYFQESHCVYNKTGLRCPHCRCSVARTGGIRKMVLGGRSTFYCATLQK